MGLRVLFDAQGLNDTPLKINMESKNHQIEKNHFPGFLFDRLRAGNTTEKCPAFFCIDN